jgi:hypothetical protein
MLRPFTDAPVYSVLLSVRQCSRQEVLKTPAPAAIAGASAARVALANASAKATCVVP